MIFLLLMIASAIVAIFVRNGGPIGLPVLLISVIVFCVCRFAKVKDAEIDQIRQKIIQDNQITVVSTNCQSFPESFPVAQFKKQGWQ